jgi:hypothetical protein
MKVAGHRSRLVSAVRHDTESCGKRLSSPGPAHAPAPVTLTCTANRGRHCFLDEVRNKGPSAGTLPDIGNAHET